MSIMNKTHRLLDKVSRSRNQLYVLYITLNLPECLLAWNKEEVWRWHAKYGSVNFRALKNLVHKKMVHGLPMTEHEESTCDGCLNGKQHWNPIPTVVQYQAEIPLELWHTNLGGPITPTIHGGKGYFLLLVDEWMGFMWKVLIRTKEESFETFKKVKTAAKMEKSCKLKALRTDCGDEFTSNEFKDYYLLLKIKPYLTTCDSPQQNGVVYQRNQTKVNMARIWLKSKGIPNDFWGKAVSTSSARDTINWRYICGAFHSFPWCIWNVKARRPYQWSQHWHKALWFKLTTPL